MNTIALRLAVAYKIFGDRLRAIPAERGATAVEYALMVGLIAAVIVGAVIALGDTIDGIFTDTEAEID